MTEGPAHPSTIAMLEAWRRMECAATDGFTDSTPGVVTGEEDALVGRIFVLQKQPSQSWPFRTAGEHLASILGRPLSGRNFLDLWSGSDRDMVNTLLVAVTVQGAPGLVRARAESLSGRELEIEIALAPLPKVVNGNPRLLGHYQDLGAQPGEPSKPVWRHSLITIVPPERRMPQPRLRLVSRNGHPI